MTRTPNTIDAHRLIWFGGQKGVQDALMEVVFKAYFIEGRDIGEHAVLADCAVEAGLDRAEVIEFLAGGLADQEMRAADQAAREAGVNGVPVVLPGRLWAVLRRHAGRDDRQRAAPRPRRCCSDAAERRDG